MRTVAEGVRSDGKPAILEIGRQVDCAAGDGGRRVRLDLSRSRTSEVDVCLGPKVQLSGSSEVLAGKYDGSSAGEGALRRLHAGGSGDGRGRRRQIRWRRRIDKTNATIGKAEEELRFVRVLDLRGDALNRRIRDAADELRSMAVENGDESGCGRRLAEI